MQDYHQIRHKIWAAKVPIRIDCDAFIDHPLYLAVSRCSYLPLLTSTVRKHYTDRGLQFQGAEMDIWYSFGDVPLRWHYPLGLLLDLYNPCGEFPWVLRVHFHQPFPADKIIKMQNHDALQDLFTSMLKESDFLRHGSVSRMMGLSREDQIQLWDAVWSDQYSRFWDVNAKLINDSDSLRHIPVRMYRLKEGGDFEYRQSLVKSSSTMADALHSNYAETGNVRVLLHGIEVPLDMPLRQLANTMTYQDNFLHVALVES